MGLELGGSFARSPNKESLFILPITAKATYLLNVSRFEIPFSLGVGMSIVRYRTWSHIDFIMKPSLGAYWQYNSNWSFGLRATWWLDFQPTTDYQSSYQARAGNFLSITPGMYYHF